MTTLITHATKTMACGKSLFLHLKLRIKVQLEFGGIMDGELKKLRA
tara:strand:- start:126 stop:263 length:138 start_codon:yes stop_codon:yes gene_type:complete